MTGRLRARGWTAGRRAIIEGWASDPPATADELRERVVAFYAERSGADQKPLKNVRVRDAVRRLGEGLHQVLLTHERLGDFGGEPVEGVVRAELGPVAVQGRPLRFDCVRHIDDRVDLVVVPADVRLFESIEIASVLAVGDQCLPKRREDRLREHGVVQTAWRPRLIRTVELGGVTRSVERGDRVLVDSDVVRVTVPAVRIERDNRIRPKPAYDLDQRSDYFVFVGVRQCCRIGIVVCAVHAGVSISEYGQIFDAERISRRSELAFPDLTEILGCGERRIGYLANLAACGSHEGDAVSFGSVQRKHASGAECLIVRVGENSQKRAFRVSVNHPTFSPYEYAGVLPDGNRHDPNKR